MSATPTVPVLVTLALVAGCRGVELGPAESYLLLAPAPEEKAAVPVVRKMPIDKEPALTLGRLLNQGFAAEMLRVVYLGKQLVRAQAGGAYADDVRAAAGEPLLLVVGAPAETPTQRGLAFATWLGGPEARASTRWVGLSANVEGDKALVQTLAGKLAAHAADWVARGAVPEPPPVLVTAYGMAAEAIAREWKAGQRGPAVDRNAGTLEQRRVYAAIKENHAIFRPGEERVLRPADELLADARVAATVLYRLAETRLLANRAGPAEIYAPFVPAGLPGGVSPAAVLGPLRNFHAKVFTAWARAVRSGRAPADIADLVAAYAEAFPDERPELYRIFLVTTFAATVVPGGVSHAPADATATLARIQALGDDLLAGRKGLRDAVPR